MVQQLVLPEEELTRKARAIKALSLGLLVAAIAGIRISRPGITIKLLTVAIASFEPNNSTSIVAVKKLAMVNVATIPAIR